MTRSRSLSISLTAALVIAAVTAGCGGSDASAPSSSAPATTAALSPAAYRAQANAICQAAAAKITALAEPDSPEAFRTFFTEYVDTTRTFVTNLNALTPPPELAKDVASYIKLQEQVVTTSQGALDGMKGGRDPESAFGDVNDDLTQLETDSSAVAKRLGLDQCIDPQLEKDGLLPE